MPIRMNAMAALASSTLTTTLWVGEIGVRPVSTAKVTNAEMRATTTAAGANRWVNLRGGRGNGGETLSASGLAAISAMGRFGAGLVRGVDAEGQQPTLPDRP